MSCKIGNENIPLPTLSPSASIQPSPSPTESLEPTPTATPSIVSSPVPTSVISPGSVFIDPPTITLVTGKVYDQDGNLVNEAKVEAEFFKPDGIIRKEGNSFSDWSFVIHAILLEPYDELKGEITVSKEGYKTVTRKIIVENKRDSSLNTFNFGGTGEEAQYALVKIE